MDQMEITSPERKASLFCISILRCVCVLNVVLLHTNVSAKTLAVSLRQEQVCVCLRSVLFHIRCPHMIFARRRV